MATTSTGSQTITGAPTQHKASSRHVWTKRIKRFLLYALAIGHGRAVCSALFLDRVQLARNRSRRSTCIRRRCFRRISAGRIIRMSFDWPPLRASSGIRSSSPRFAMFGQILSASAVAYGFSRFRFPGRDALFFVVLSTMMLPWQVTIVPLFLLFRYLGWINTFLPLIVPSFFGGGAFYIFLLRQFFMTIPRDLDEAAKLDGASSVRVFWNIILPLSTAASPPSRSSRSSSTGTSLSAR